MSNAERSSVPGKLISSGSSRINTGIASTRSYSTQSSTSPRERSATVTAHSQNTNSAIFRNSQTYTSTDDRRRSQHVRSHQNLRAMASQQQQQQQQRDPAPLARNTSIESNSPTPTGPGSRSRSGSVARLLSVNTGVAPSSTTTQSPISFASIAHALEDELSSTLSPRPEPSTSPSASVAVSPASSGHSPSQAAATSVANGGGGPFGTMGPSAASGIPPQLSNSGSSSRSIKHKASTRTVGESSSPSTGNSTNTNSASAPSAAPRKSSTASTSRTIKDVSRTRDKERDRERGTDKADSKRDRDRVDRSSRARYGLTAGGSIGSSIASQYADLEEREGLRKIPRLDVHSALAAPPTLMYWSRAPVWGQLPMHKMRSHSATVVDNQIWLFGGCDDRDFWRDVMCLDVETLEWTRPETTGDVPPPCRAHTATLVDRRLFVFGGGQGNAYYNSLYILDTITRRWTYVPFNAQGNSASASSSSSASGHTHTLSSSTPGAAPTGNSKTNGVGIGSGDSEASEAAEDETIPRPRRAHTTVVYKNRLIVFGGGNGAQALNDVWVLDVSVHPDRMRWVKQKTSGGRPSPRGYHTANLVGNVMVVVGGSDGRQTFSDIYCLNLDTFHWTPVRVEKSYRRLAHTATQVGSYLFILGGHDGSAYTNELLLFNLVSLMYETRTILGQGPTQRGYHAAVLADGRLWTFGGYEGRLAYDDIHILELASSAYLSQVTGFQINV